MRQENEVRTCSLVFFIAGTQLRGAMNKTREPEELKHGTAAADIRWTYGRLLARWCATGIEIDCTRCRCVRTLP